MEKLVIIYWEATIQGVNSGRPIVAPSEHVWSSGNLQDFIRQQKERTREKLRTTSGAMTKITLSYTNIQVFDNDLPPAPTQWEQPPANAESDPVPNDTALDELRIEVDKL